MDAHRPDKASYKSTSQACCMWKGPRRAPQAEEFPSAQRQLGKDGTSMCNNKLHCISLNTFQKYSANVLFLPCSILNFLGEVTEDNQSRQVLKSKLVSRQQDTPVDQVRMQVWHENIGTLIIICPQPARQIIKSVFNQQAGVFLLTQLALSHIVQADDPQLNIPLLKNGGCQLIIFVDV